MDNIISYFEAHNLSMSFYQESASAVNTRLTTTIGSLLSGDELAEALSLCWGNDIARVSMESDLEENCVCESNSDWLDAYVEFVKKHDDGDQVIIEVHIDKRSETIGIYKFNEYWKEISNISTEELMNYFSDLLKEEDTLAFHVMDDTVEVITQFIHISNSDSPFAEKRNKYIKKYHAASLFLNRTSITLIPEDFHIIKGNYSSEVIDVFKKLETIMSMIYLANSAYIMNDVLVIQLKPDGTMECPLDTLNCNAVLCDLCEWVYDCDNAVERAGIARNIVSLYCNSMDDLLNVDNDVISSVKSNYVIYQRNTTQEYIETKNKISESVISLVKDQEELIKEIGDSFRNNCIAIFTFIITVVLAGVDVNDLIANNLPWTIRFVAALIIVASTVYLIVCLVSSSIKIESLKRVYDRIKTNYEEVLDAKDLDNTFGKTYEETVFTVKKYCMCIFVIWCAFIIIMIGLLVYFSGYDLSWLKPNFSSNAFTGLTMCI